MSRDVEPPARQPGGWSFPAGRGRLSQQDRAITNPPSSCDPSGSIRAAGRAGRAADSWRALLRRTEVRFGQACSTFLAFRVLNT